MQSDGYTQSDPEEVFPGEGIGLCVDLAAEETEDRLGGQQIDRGKYEATPQAQHDGVTDTAVGIVSVVRA